MEADLSRLKRLAAEKAVDLLSSGVVLGLGHGSTAAFAYQRLAELMDATQLKDLVAVPCSAQAEAEAKRLGIPLTTLERHAEIDVTIDGADEVDGAFNLIKGGGGALLREKIVAQVSRREIIVVDESKLSPVLGTQRAVPVEVVPFGWRCQFEYLKTLKSKVTLRENGEGQPFETDQGNYILDCHFGPISNLHRLAERLDRRAGIVAHGLFLGLATDVIVAGLKGVRHFRQGGTKGRNGIETQIPI